MQKVKKCSGGMDMLINEKSALVLQGGSLRCLFTAGVLDIIMKEEIHFPYVNGVSAGSLSGMNYVSEQPERTRNVNITFANDRRYIGVNNLLFHNGIFNFDFLYGKISNEYMPLDRDTFEKSPCRYVAVATNCRTGNPEYFE